MASKISQDVRTLVELKGNVVGMDSEKCNQWRKEHENCFGCQFELGCSKLVGVMLSCFDIDPGDKTNSILESNDPEFIRNTDFTFVDGD